MSPLQMLPMAATVAALSAVSSAGAAELPACGSFTLGGGDFHVEVIDRGAEGDSIGDKRIGERELLDEGGNVIGMLRFIEEVVDFGEEATVTHSDNIYELPGGTLHADALFLTDQATDAGNQPRSSSSIAVIGGTGVFVRSRGQISATFTPGKPSSYAFELHCD